MFQMMQQAQQATMFAGGGGGAQMFGGGGQAMPPAAVAPFSANFDNVRACTLRPPLPTSHVYAHLTHTLRTPYAHLAPYARHAARAMRGCMRTCICTLKHTHASARAHTRTYAHTHTRAHTHTYTRTHTHARTGRHVRADARNHDGCCWSRGGADDHLPSPPPLL